MKIILAEDELRALKGIRNLITSIDPMYEVVAEASDGRQALDLILSLQPDLVITDIKMPFVNGIELIKAAHSYSLGTRFIVVSAFAEFEYAKEAMSLGVKEYLLKPITYWEVADCLKRVYHELKNQIAGTAERESLVKQYPNAHYLIQRAIGIIETSYATKISQSNIAESLGLTKEYFSYLFHKETGTKFTDFVNNYRIEVAKLLLLSESPPLKIHEISDQTGFSDEKYFCRVFKNRTGLTPNLFKKSIRKNV